MRKNMEWKKYPEEKPQKDEKIAFIYQYLEHIGDYVICHQVYWNDEKQCFFNEYYYHEDRESQNDWPAQDVTHWIPYPDEPKNG